MSCLVNVRWVTEPVRNKYTEYVQVDLILDFNCPACAKPWSISILASPYFVKQRVQERPHLAKCFPCRVSAAGAKEQEDEHDTHAVGASGP